MALSEKILIDEINLWQDRSIGVQQARVVYDDAAEIARSHTRWVLHPGDDVSAQTPELQAIAQTVWTPDVLAAYQQTLAPKPEV